MKAKQKHKVDPLREALVFDALETLLNAPMFVPGFDMVGLINELCRDLGYIKPAEDGDKQGET
jgi:hypothetical protein